jgi:hypothetical protein
MFSEQERAFLQSQRLARIATVATDGQLTGRYFDCPNSLTTRKLYVIV